MITNQRQYKITRAEIAKFEKAVAAARQTDPSPGVDPLIHKAVGDALTSQLDDLKKDALEYETLKRAGFGSVYSARFENSASTHRGANRGSPLAARTRRAP